LRNRVATTEAWRNNFELGVRRAQAEQQNRAAWEYRNRLVDEMLMSVNPPPPSPEQQPIESAGTGLLGFADYNPKAWWR
jgi:hypothetical protein